MSLSPRAFRWLPRAWRPAELWQRNLLVMTIAAGANHTGFDLINPFLPLFVLELGESDFGSAARWSGLLVGITPFMTAFVGPGWGALADRFGRKRVALVVMGSYVIILALMGRI